MNARPPAPPVRSSSAAARFAVCRRPPRPAARRARPRARARSRDRRRARRPATAAPPADAALVAQELVDGGQLAADAGGFAARAFDRALGVADGGTALLRARVAGLTIGAAALDELGLALERPRRPVPSLAPALRARARARPRGRGRARRAPARAQRSERSRRCPRARRAAPRRRPASVAAASLALRRRASSVAEDGLDRFGAIREPLGRASCCVGPARQLLAPGAARRQRLLGRLAPAGDRLELPLERGTPGANLRRGALRLGERQPVPAYRVARQLPADLERLALEARVQLGGLGLALERAQPRARLALDVERTVEIVLRTGELQLRAAPALAVLAEPGRLLDQQAPITRLRGDDRFDAALRDDRVHLLAEPRVGQQLDHVDQPAARAREPVLPLPRAVESPVDRDLRRAERQRSLAVVEYQLDLGAGGRLAARGAGEDHVLHRLAADVAGRLLAERPQHRVGDVGLAGPVGADDHAHAGTELEPAAVRERLEALDGDRFQVHVGLISTSTPAPPAPLPARRPSCCGRRRSRSRLRRSSRGP